MRIATWNVCGLRAALRKGFERHLALLSPDLLMLQEIRTRPDQLPEPHAAPPGWHVLWHPAEKAGYAGTALWSRTPLEEVGRGLDEADPDGRVLQARVGGLTAVVVYLPSGSSGPERQAAKEAWMERFLPWAARLAARPDPVILGGDINIAHTPLDIHDPRATPRTPASSRTSAPGSGASWSPAGPTW